MLSTRMSKGLYKRILANQTISMSKGELQQWFVESWNATYANFTQVAIAMCEDTTSAEILMRAARAVLLEMQVRFPGLRRSGYNMYMAVSPRGSTCRLYLDVAPKGVIVTDAPVNWTLH